MASWRENIRINLNRFDLFRVGAGFFDCNKITTIEKKELSRDILPTPHVDAIFFK
jgi:hypothetical protein